MCQPLDSRGGLGEVVPLGSRRSLASSTAYNIRMAIETDYELFSTLGSEGRLVAYVGELLGAASAIYSRDVRASLQVGYIDVWATPNDPWTKTFPNDMLTEAANYWHFNRADVPRNLMHFMSARSGGGIADQSALCSPDIDLGNGNWVGAYALSAGLFGHFSTVDLNYSVDLRTVAHEIGHNCGSPHTHCYSPPIDHCWSGEPLCYAGPLSTPSEGGTIMSYCELAKTRLALGRPGEASQAVTDRIRAYIESKASCLTIADSCSLSVEPSAATFGPPGGSGSLSIAGDPACPWTAVSNAAFLRFTSNDFGSGNRTLTYSVEPNQTGAARSGTLMVAGQTVTISQTAEACVTGGASLCLNGGRFRATVAWTNPYVTPNTTGAGTASSLTSDTGSFWFFSSNNIELVVKVLDGRGTNGKFWVFYGALSDVGYTITITDTETGAVRTYVNPPYRLASAADIEAF